MGSDLGLTDCYQTSVSEHPLPFDAVRELRDSVSSEVSRRHKGGATTLLTTEVTMLAPTACICQDTHPYNNLAVYRACVRYST